jgi:hypothetical protein
MAVTVGMVLGACGGSGKTTPASSPTPARQISIHGEVDQTDNTYCESTHDYVSRAQIVFRDGKGTVIGTAMVGKATTRSTSSGIFAACGRTGTYSIEVPQEPLYRVTWVGVDQSPRTVSYRDLAAKGFRFDLIAAFNEP